MDQHETDKRLQHSTEPGVSSLRLEALFESLGDAVFLIDSSSRKIRKCNQAASFIFGYAPDELVGMNTAILHVDDASYREFGHKSEAVLLAHRTYRGQFRMKRKDGSVFPSEHVVTRFQKEGETGEDIISLVRDISWRKKLEERSRQAQKMEAVARLAGGVAHDFNNLMQGLLMHTELLKTSLQGTEAEEHLDGISALAAQCSDLSRQLLSLSRQKPKVIERIEMGQFIDEALPVLRRICGERIRVKVEKGKEPLSIRGDRTQLNQVLLNLVMNAVDAMPEGGTLTVATFRKDFFEDPDDLTLTAGSYVEVQVADTGSGMDPETKERVFEPFFTTKEEGKGTGVGLSLLYGIIQQHEGDVYLQSEKGQGTTFHFFLPLAADPVGESPAFEDGQGASQETRSGETVLVVDDEETVRIMVERLLSKKGFRVMIAGDGYEAMNLLRETDEAIDLVLTDLVMPGMSGKELIRNLRSEYPRVRILCMSGYKGDTREEISVPFIGKPFTPKLLLEKLRAVLQQG